MANLIQNVRVIAIPLEKQSNLAGLTRFNGLPGIRKTGYHDKKPCIDIDIEAEGLAN